MRFMRSMLLLLIAAAPAAAAQDPSGDLHALRERIEARYVAVVSDDGVVLRPRARTGDVRVIEIKDGAIALNGAAATGRELRERLGADADAVVRLSYLPAERLKTLFPPPAPEPPADPADVPLERSDEARPEAGEQAAPRQDAPRARRAQGDRVRVFGDVTVDRDEEITGQVVAVFGSVRIDGTVGDQVVSVFGSVSLGPTAVVRGDIVSVGGRVRRANGAQTRGSVTEVSLADPGFNVGPLPDVFRPLPGFGSIGAVPRLVGTGFRMLLLLILTGLALVVARRSVEASAQRVSDDPVKTTVIGLVAELLILPVLFITAFVLAVSIIGIPLLLLLPIVVLLLAVMAVVGFAGAAAAIGRGVQRRLSMGTPSVFGSVLIGIVVILSPLILGRMMAVAGWPVTPVALLLVGAGFAFELLVWASGFGAVLANGLTRWQARRSQTVVSSQ